MNNVPMLKSKWKQESKMVKIIFKIQCVIAYRNEFLLIAKIIALLQ